MSVQTLLGHLACEDYFPAEDLTPNHDYIETNDYDPDVGDIEVKVTPEMGDAYVGAEVKIPCGGILKRGKVTSWKQAADRNPTGLADDNPILDTREYVVQFEDGAYWLVHIH